MASPPNQTALTAMAITSLPFTVTQDVADQLSTLQLWYTYTAQPGDRMLGCVPYSDVSGTYEPALTVYQGPASAPTLYKINNSVQRAGSIPVTVGGVYLFKVTQHGATSPVGASLTFRLETAPLLDAPASSIIAGLSSVSGYRTPVIAGYTDETFYYYIADVGFMAAAIGAGVSDGTILGDDANTSTLMMYDSSLTRIYSGLPSYFAYTPDAISSDWASTFYLLYDDGFGTPKKVRTLTSLGAETTDAWTLPSNSSTALAGTPSRDGTIYYYGGNTATAVHRYDLVNHIALSDLVAAIATYNVTEMLALGDGSLLVVYRKLGGSPDYNVLHYSAAGATLNTYAFGTTWIDHIALDPNDSTGFWVWLHNTASSPTTSTYRFIKISDGSTIKSAAYKIFNAGPMVESYDPSYVTAESVPLFGPEGTCTFFITKASSPPTPAPPMPAGIEDPIRWVRRSPTVFADGKRLFVTRVQFDFQPGVGLSSLPTDESHDPVVRYRTSWNGGITWSGFREFTLGAQGEYLKLMRVWQNGSGYAFVAEVSGNTPTDLCLVQAWIDLEGGSH